MFQLHNVGKGAQLHGSRVSDGLHHLVHPLIRTSPVQDPHTEQAKEDQIVDTGLINLLKPFCPSDNVGPKSIVEE